MHSPATQASALNALSPHGAPRSVGPPPTSHQLAASPSSYSSVNTPQSQADQPAPSSQEDQAYLDKVRQLGKYIEPLRKMISRIGEDDQERLSKMKKLLDILATPSKRMPMDTLLKCEAVLERMNLDTGPPSVPPPDPVGRDGMNPLLEAIIKVQKMQKSSSGASSSVPLNHTLQRTFGAPLEALFGVEISLPSINKRRRRDAAAAADDDRASAGDDIPDVLQREVAMLQSYFKVTLDSTQPTNIGIRRDSAKMIRLICDLDDVDLPSVPSLPVTLPHNYPDEAPHCDPDDVEEYAETPFLQNIAHGLRSRIQKMPARHTLSQLLTNWEYAVRAAAAPTHDKAYAQAAAAWPTEL